MHILPLNTIKYSIGVALSSAALSFSTPAASQSPLKLTEAQKDTFELVNKTQKTINPVDRYTSEDLPTVFREPVNPSGWTNDPEILKNAPDPYFTLKGKKILARGTIDITNCRFYAYDDNGKAIESFRVATGASRTPTKSGIRKVLKKQVYPYLDCERWTKRRRFPFDYGPKIAYLNVVDTITGKMFDNGSYVHGTRHEEAVLRTNRHLTHSCVRFHNRDALYVINDVLKIGDYLKYVKR